MSLLYPIVKISFPTQGIDLLCDTVVQLGRIELQNFPSMPMPMSYSINIE